MLNLGLLLDVDGPIANPEQRKVVIPSILDDLVALTAAGVPIAFITGRSDAFIRDEVVEPLLAVGLGDALRTPGARMYGVFEKGGTWATISPEGIGELAIDESLQFPQEYVDGIRTLVEKHFASEMFFDETKLAMISVEQQTTISAEEYRGAQQRFNDAAFSLAADLGIPLSYGDRSAADGTAPFRIDPTIISTDIESIQLDKDHGARRALEQFRAAGPLPTVWRTVGDSRSDYKMADALHADGFDVAHVDVRPADGILDRPYRVIVEPDGIHDVAGAALLRYWAKQL